MKLHHIAMYIIMSADDVVLLHHHQPALPDVVNTDHLQQDIEACKEWAQSVYGNFSPYKGYVRPTVEYAVSIWYLHLSSEQLSLLGKLQAKMC